MFEKNKLTNNVGIPAADNQDVMTAGAGFCAHKWSDVLPRILQVSH